MGCPRAHIKHPAEELRGRMELDATGCYVLPGAIDSHVHLQMPVGNYVSSDDFANGTIAAALGGTTTVIDFVEPEPGEPLLDALEKRRAEADGGVAVDYGLHRTIPTWHAALRQAQDAAHPLGEGLPTEPMDTLSEVMAAGAPSFKLYLAYEGFRLDDAQLYRVLKAIASVGGLPIIRCENGPICETLRAQAGITTFYDCLEAPYALPGALEVEAEVVRRWGLRGVLSFEATERVSAENGELGLRENEAFVVTYREQGGLVFGLMCFHTTFTCSTDFIRRAFALAAECDAKVHMHLSEGTYEPEYSLAHFGLHPVVYYDQLGVFSPHVLASQCVQVDAEEIEVLARRGVHVSRQPLSNCEVGGGFAPLPEMLEAGINVALGTDGYVNNFF